MAAKIKKGDKVVILAGKDNWNGLIARREADAIRAGAIVTPPRTFRCHACR